VARIAIVSYFFPPGDEIGGLRPSALARGLARLGHDVLVVTHQSKPGEEGFRAVAVGQPAEAVPAPAAPAEAGATSGLKGLARRALAVPDGKTRWALKAAAALRREVRGAGLDAVITTGPPHSVHLAALWALPHRGAGRPRWVVDMRDLWTDNPYYDYGELRRRLDRLIESDVMHAADAVAATTAGFARSLEQRHGIRAANILTGFDDLAQPPTPQPATEPLRVVHAGNLYAGRRDPSALIEALGTLAAEDRAKAERVRLVFIGPGLDAVAEVAERNRVRDLVELVPPISRAEVLVELARAGALLLVQWRNDETAAEVPGKLFEYLALRKPVIALGAAPEGEVAAILAATGAGRVVGSVAECREALLALLDGTYAGPDEERLAPYGQSRMAEAFARVALAGEGAPDE
jgi:glycosyltransferase involved in cell wall biosynthesis